MYDLEKQLSHTIDPRFVEIFSKFENLFKSQGYFLWDKFDRKVWFLKRDIEKLKMENDNDVDLNYLFKYGFDSSIDDHKILTTSITTTMANNPNFKSKLYNLIQETNESDVKKDMNKFVCTVEKFISGVVSCLLNSSEKIKQSQQLMNKNKAMYKRYEIEDKIKLIEKENSISILNSSDNERELFNSLREKEKEKENSSKLNFEISNIEDRNLDDFHVKIVEFTSKDSHSKLCDRLVKFTSHVSEPIEFAFFDDNKFEEYFKNISFCGVSISNFSVALKQGNKIFESSNINFIDIFLSHLDDLLDQKKTKFSQTFTEKLINNDTGSFLQLNITINFTISIIARIGILKKILNIFINAVELKQTSWTNIDDIMNNYFKEISEGVKAKLFDHESERDNCCAKCIII